MQRHYASVVAMGVAWVIACPSHGTAQEAQPETITVWGRVVDENNEPVLGRTRITLTKQDGVRIVDDTKADGSYAVVVPTAGLEVGDVVESIRFRRSDRHPGVITNIAGQIIKSGLPEPPPGSNQPIEPSDPNKSLSGAVVREDYSNKVLFPRVGPQGYERNMAQLLTYEYLYHVEMGEGRSRRELYDENAYLLAGMPTIYDTDDLGDINRTQLDSLAQKRRQVFALYGVELPEGGGQTKQQSGRCRGPLRRLLGRR